MINVDLPPNEEFSLEFKAYLERLIRSVQNEIDSTNTVSRVTELPARPLEGKLYYLTRTIDLLNSEGYYVYNTLNNEWNKLAYDIQP